MFDIEFNFFPVAQVVKDEKLFLPVGLVREWQDHSQVGHEFKSWMETFLKDHAIIDPAEQQQQQQQEENPDADPEGRKRAAAGGGQNPSPNKRARVINPVDSTLIVDSNSITTAMINEYEVQKGKDLSVALQLRAEQQVYLLNKGTKPWKALDPMVCGFGNGTWKVVKPNTEKPPNSVQLCFKNHEALILLNGTLQTIGQAVNDMRLKKPDAKIAYHTIQEGESLQEFNLTVTHQVAFVAKIEEGTEMSQKNVALKLYTDGVNSPLQLIWYMRWSTKGLTPIKPALHLVGNVELAGGKALKCWK